MRKHIRITHHLCSLLLGCISIMRRIRNFVISQTDYRGSDNNNAKDLIMSLLSSIGVNIQEQIVTAFRLGCVNKQAAAKRPRQILFKMSNQATKFKIYKNVKHQTCMYIKDDLPADTAQQQEIS